MEPLSEKEVLWKTNEHIMRKENLEYLTLTGHIENNNGMVKQRMDTLINICK